MKITALLENTSCCGLPTEHGLSLFVETENCCFLFDMGQTGLFARNADALGTDLNAADFAVLSHGHYDHGGGLATFFERNSHAPVYMSSHAFEPHYHGEKYIGLDQNMKAYSRILFVDREKEIVPGFTLYNPDAFKAADATSGGLSMVLDGVMRPEDFRHEQYLLAEENGKRVLFSGCSHRGILNIVQWFQPDVLIGGFHLSRYPLDDMLASLAEKLDSFPTVYYTCHCTGAGQYRFMQKRMKNLHYLSTGEQIII